MFWMGAGGGAWPGWLAAVRCRFALVRTQIQCDRGSAVGRRLYRASARCRAWIPGGRRACERGGWGCECGWLDDGGMGGWSERAELAGTREPRFLICWTLVRFPACCALARMGRRCMYTATHSARRGPRSAESPNRRRPAQRAAYAASRPAKNARMARDAQSQSAAAYAMRAGGPPRFNAPERDLGCLSMYCIYSPTLPRPTVPSSCPKVIPISASSCFSSRRT